MSKKSHSLYFGLLKFPAKHRITEAPPLYDIKLSKK